MGIGGRLGVGAAALAALIFLASAGARGPAAVHPHRPVYHPGRGARRRSSSRSIRACRRCPAYTAGQASAVALSPDGRTLLILTSGFNLMFSADGKPVPGASTEFVFVYRRLRPHAGAAPGAARSPTASSASPGRPPAIVSTSPAASTTRCSSTPRGDAGFATARTFALGHKAGVGLAVKPEAGALAVSPDGKRLLVANFQNDSVSLIDLATGHVARAGPAPRRDRSGQGRNRPAAASPARWPGPPTPRPMSPASATARSSRSTSPARPSRSRARIRTRGPAGGAGGARRAALRRRRTTPTGSPSSTPPATGVVERDRAPAAGGAPRRAWPRWAARAPTRLALSPAAARSSHQRRRQRRG